jgi:hypothetical protein
MSTEVKDILPIMQAIADADAHSSVWWRTDGEYAPVSFLVNCNDIFCWACADAEELTIENLPVFVQACKDASEWGPELFCARVRGERPQGAVYKGMTPEQAAFFNACGPAREISLVNPRPNVPGKPRTEAAQADQQEKP